MYQHKRPNTTSQSDASGGGSAPVPSYQQAYGNQAAQDQIEGDEVQPVQVVGTQVQHRRSPPTQGSVADLSSESGIADLSSADWAYLPGSDPVYIQLSDLPEGERATLTSALATFCASEAYDPATGFTLQGTTITLGGPTTDFDFSGDTASAQSVLNRSNDVDAYGVNKADKKTFDFLNGGHTELDKEDTPTALQVGPQDKPASWYNGFVIEGDMVVPKQSDFDGREGVLPEPMTLAQYQEMLVRDFNFDGAIDTLGTEENFVKAMTERFAQGHPTLDEDGFKAVCREVWSYATTGMDSNETTDIAQMQALLRQLSPDIAESSDSNTPMTGDMFTIPGTDIEIARGDGKHGRATVLETRHLLAGLDPEVSGPQTLELVEGDLTERDYFVRDDTGSWQDKWDTMSDSLDDEFGFDEGNGLDSRVLAKIDYQSVNMVDNTKSTKEDRKDNFPQAIRDAYALIHPKDTQDDRVAFAALFGLPVDKVFSEGGTIQVTTLRSWLGDTSAEGGDYGATGESGIKGIIMTLLYSDAFDPTALEAMEEHERPRINAVMDEAEQSIEWLPLAQALADALDVEARIIAVPTDVDEDFVGNPNDQLQYVDIQKIVVHDDNTISYEYTQGGETKEGETFMDANELENGRLSSTGDKATTQKDKRARFKQSSVAFGEQYAGGTQSDG